MRALPTLLLALSTVAANAQEPLPAGKAAEATAPGTKALEEQTKGYLADMKARLKFLHMLAPGAKANLIPAAGDTCAIPLLDVKPAPGVSFTMPRTTAGAANMAPMPQIHVAVCESPAH